MTDDPSPKSDTPFERNVRRLIDVLATHPEGACTEDLRRAFELETGLGRQSYYNSLAAAKARQWIIGDGEQGKLNVLNPDGAWKKPPLSSTGEVLERDRLEHVVNLQTTQIEELPGENKRLLNGIAGDNVAVSALVRIVADGAVSTPRRLKAAAAVLNYRVSDVGIIEFVRRYLEIALCEHGHAR
jgi:hypothetical protein